MSSPLGCVLIVDSHEIESAFKMPRIPRLKVKVEPAVYHAMSRTTLDAFMLGNMEGEDAPGDKYSVKPQKCYYQIESLLSG